ncbi:multivesicular body subunit 12-like Mvb12 [Oratosquilla oratoria]|uniref:multivesicular body subunit 12-like Mvb12 n=1 Tax=Oratosquilla oratoria TaxID=337810 RepID=UPI003F75C103
MMRDLYNALPDDRPITSISVVEELAGCPVNYTAVSKTHDQDIDADLYKDGFFRRVTRYLCHSKTEGYMGYIVENILIINDRDCRPTGFTIIEQTQDTGQKAFKKKQICYKAVPRHMASQSVTDIIILSRSKVAPEGFTLVGEMNGLCICYKPGPVPPAPTPNKSSAQPSSSPLPYGVNPAGGVSSSTGGNGALYPGLSPSRPAPQPPGGPVSGPLSPPPPLPPRNIGAPYNSPSHASRDTSTLYGPPQSALFGVPFTLNQKYVKSSQNGSTSNIPNPGKKSRQQVEDEYYYSFTLEQDVLQRPTS